MASPVADILDRLNADTQDVVGGAGSPVDDILARMRGITAPDATDPATDVLDGLAPPEVPQAIQNIQAPLGDEPERLSVLPEHRAPEKPGFADRLKSSVRANVGLIPAVAAAKALIPAAKAGTGTIQSIGATARFLGKRAEDIPIRLPGFIGVLQAIAGPLQTGGKALSDLAKENRAVLEKFRPTKRIAIRDSEGKLKFNVDAAKDPQFWADTIVETVVGMAPAIATGGGSIAAAGAVAGVLEAAPFYEEMLDSGVNEKEAAAKAVVFGAVVAGLEKIGFDKMFKGTGIKRAIISALTESATEFAEEPISKTIELLGKKGVTFKEGKRQVWEAVKDAVNTLPGSLLVGGGIGGSQLGVRDAAQEETGQTQALDQAETQEGQEGVLEPSGVTPLQSPSEAATTLPPPLESLVGTPEEAGAAVQAREQAETARIGVTPSPAREAQQIGVDLANIKTARQARETATKMGIDPGGVIGSVKKKITTVNQALEVLNQSTDPIEKLTAAMVIHRQALPKTKALRREELAKRFQKANFLMGQASGQEGIRLGKSALAGQQPIAEREPVAKFFNKAEVDQITDVAAAAGRKLSVPERIQAGDAIARLMNGQALRAFELKTLGRVFGPEFAKAAKPLTITGRISNAAVQSAGLLRTLKTMLDVSAIGRQGALLGVPNPKTAFRSMKKMSEGLFDEANYEALDDAIRADPRFPVLEASGMYLAPVRKEGVEMREREESFSSEWSDLLPGAKISERAFNGYLNALRADYFYQHVDAWGDTATIDDYKKLARVIDKFSGRGGFEKGSSKLGDTVEEAMPLLQTGFFSPRWALSRIQAPMEAITPIRDSATGKLRWSPANTVAIKNMAKYYGLMITMLAIAKAAGASVEDDPRSSDFAKIKVGNTRIDLSAGMQPYLRFLSQMISGQRKNLTRKSVDPINREKLFWRFIRSKMAPLPGVVFSAMTGKTFTGDEFVPTGDEPTTQALAQYARDAGFGDKTADRIAATGQITVRELSPLIIQQTIEGIQNDGPLGGLVSGGAEFIGVSASSFPPRTKSRRTKRAKRRTR